MNIPVCKSCKLSFDAKTRRPIILAKCGHSVCSMCIKSQIDNPKLLNIVCPEDNQVSLTDLRKSLQNFSTSRKHNTFKADRRKRRLALSRTQESF